jgi:hypothetical protein
MDSLYIKETARKYQQTVVAFRHLDTGKKLCTFFAELRTQSDGTCEIRGNFAEPDANNKFRVLDFRVPLHRVELLPMPDRQVFDALGRTLIYERSPQRQWQKGLCRNNTKLIDIVASTITNSIPKNIFYKVQQLFTRIEFTPADLYNLLMESHAKDFKGAITEILDGKLLSRSFSKSCYVMLVPSKTPKFILYRFEIPLASYDMETNTFKLYDKTYYQEVLDLVNRQKLFSKIEV